MAVKKVFVGTSNIEVLIDVFKDENLLYLEIVDRDYLDQIQNVMLDFETTIALRDELNRLVQIMENNQL
jgi:hypothetical protein